jgi:hypothetical protein
MKDPLGIHVFFSQVTAQISLPFALPTYGGGRAVML